MMLLFIRSGALIVSSLSDDDIQFHPMDLVHPLTDHQMLISCIHGKTEYEIESLRRFSLTASSFYMNS